MSLDPASTVSVTTKDKKKQNLRNFYRLDDWCQQHPHVLYENSNSHLKTRSGPTADSVYGRKRERKQQSKKKKQRQRQMGAEMDKDRYSNVSFVNFYHKFSQSVSVNQTTCPIPSVEIP